MNFLDQYKRAALSTEELSEITDHLMRSKYDYERQQRWIGTLAANYQVIRQPSATRGRRIYLYIAGAAAVVLLLLLALPLLKNTETTPYQAMVDDYLSTDFYRYKDGIKGEQDIEQLEVLAANAYNKKEFATAIDLYTQIVEAGSANDEHYFFLGLSQLYSFNYTLAESYLNQVRQLNPNSRFREETQWFLALSLLKSHNVAAGQQALLAIKPNEWNYDKAQLLLKALE